VADPLAPPCAWSLRPDGIALSVRLTPKSARDALEGQEVLADGRCVLKARVRAVPEAGRANEALRRLVAEALRVPASRVTLETGATGRVKVLRIEGDPAALAVRLAELLGQGA
jgi:uncharacterized protein YggU (UPF0235/DUF167 family)